MMPDDDWTTRSARRKPVPSGQCIWCKHPIEDDPTPIGKNETICDNCRNDLRQFKRTQRVMVVAAEGFGVSAELIADTTDQFHRELVELYGDDPAMYRLPDVVSNATDRHPISTPGDDHDP